MLLSSGLHGRAFSKRNQLIHGPLVVSMGSVLHGFDLPGWGDQEVGREAQRASREPQAKMTVRHPAYTGAQGLEAHEAKRRFHAEFFVENLLRIAHQHEW